VTQSFTIALLQMVAHGDDQEANQAKGDAFCRRAAAMGADLALFPEMWNVGYDFYDAKRDGGSDTWKTKAITQQSPFFVHFQQLAQEINIAIALTYLQTWRGAPRNSVSVIDRHGHVLMTYAKVHTCDFDTEARLTPGDDFKVCTLSTVGGDVEIGAMICFDREHPEPARILMLQGAEIILTPNACTLEANRLGQFRTRAFENEVGLAMANYATPQENGHSVAHDAVAFGEDGASLDTLLIEAGPCEDVLLARFDMERIRSYRQREAFGNAYRKPHRYAMLTSLEVRPPFIRHTTTGELYDRSTR
jgi:N-carbamoylputrescine amidase